MLPRSWTLESFEFDFFFLLFASLFLSLEGVKSTCEGDHLGLAYFHFSRGSLQLDQTSWETLGAWHSQQRPQGGSLDSWWCSPPRGFDFPSLSFGDHDHR